MEFTIGNFLIVSLLIVGTFSFAIKPVEEEGEAAGTVDKQSVIAGGIKHKDPLLDLPRPLSEMIQQVIKTVEKEGQAAVARDKQGKKPLRMGYRDPLRDYLFRKLSEMRLQGNKDSPIEVEKAGQLTTTIYTPSAGEYYPEDLLFDFYLKPLLEKIRKYQERKEIPQIEKVSIPQTSLLSSIIQSQ
ncbi:unnamed protein product [Orchesella dallaii]|uniref:Uncharacterized protein n=1 Tax=Orchesella dallaii TaxID=48710 RepID=A0ABP1PPQ4_9HEXA